jgi:prepilin signal peptidase PulO-like enzyme (type II secretory pathway)
VEIVTGILFAYLYWHYGLSAELALIALYFCLFLVLMVIDLEHGIIPNKIVYPSMVVALVISVFLPPSRVAYPGEAATLLFNSFLPQPGIAQAAIGGGIGLVLFLLIVIVSRGGMGWGDVKMSALIGIITGYMIPVALFLAVILGGLVAVILLLFKLKKRKEGIPFGPYLALGVMITLLFGNNILNWYLGML